MTQEHGGAELAHGLARRRKLTKAQRRAMKAKLTDGRLAVAKTPPSPDQVAAACTPAGGWTRDTLAGWGVPWPPPKGWRDSLRRSYEARQMMGKQS